MGTLENLREKIDTIDEQLVSLFDERMQVSLAVAKYKEENGLPVLNKSREHEILEKISKMSREDTQNYTKILYSEILGLSKAYQRQYINGSSPVSDLIKKTIDETPNLFPEKANVACQGVARAYSEHACNRIFKSPNVTFADTWEDVFKLINDSKCRYGILPIENSTAGSVNKVYDLMKMYNFYIVRSIRIHVEHSLLANKGTELKDIKEVFSHEQAISQCAEFLNSLDDVKITVVKNTAAAAKMVAESGRKDVAAICSEDCKDLYDLICLKSCVQNVTNNYTRFICISKQPEIFPGADRSSIMLTAAHRPGSLYSILTKLNAHRINMLKLESRPVPERDFEFSFYFDIEQSVYSPDLYQFFDELYSENIDFTYFGSYREVI